MEGNLHFKIDWASLIVGRKCTVFALFYFVFEGNFQVQAPGGGGGYIWRGNLTEVFLQYEFGGLIFGGAYFLNFKVPVAAHECTLAPLTADNRFSGQGKWEAMIMGSCRI